MTLFIQDIMRATHKNTCFFNTWMYEDICGHLFYDPHFHLFVKTLSNPP